MGKLFSELTELTSSSMAAEDLAAIYDMAGSPRTTKKATLASVADYILTRHQTEIGGVDQTVAEAIEEAAGRDVLARDYKTAKK